MEFSRETTVSYFDNEAKTYTEKSYVPNTPNSVRLEIVQRLIEGLPKGRVLDAGCGSGKLLTYLVEQGYDVAGTDISPGMIDQTRAALSEVSNREIDLWVTPLDDLSMFDDRSSDIVTCLGVLPYVPEEVEHLAYKEITRVLKPGGYFISAHQNELFDLFTFNRYTLRFFDKNVLPLIANLHPDLDTGNLREQIAGLMTNSDKPTLDDEKKSSQRGYVFTKPENPLTFSEKLESYGLRSLDNSYYNIHFVPPLLKKQNPDLDRLDPDLERSLSHHWLGMFMASTFVNLARLEGWVDALDDV